MNIYIYTKTGHNIGLDALRRGCVLYKQLEQKQCEPILCTSDYRAATFARDLGAYKGIGVDIIGNLPNIMERNDMLIFESDEPNETTRKFMLEYCNKLYEIGTDIPRNLVDDMFFNGGDKSITKAFFLGDDDYSDSILKVLCSHDDKYDITLLMGHYFFLGNDEKLKPYFENIIDEEDYQETILNTQYLLTGSINAVFESLASGNSPVFYKRSDKQNEDISIIKEYNIPIVHGDNMSDILRDFNDIILDYPQVKTLEKVDTSEIINEISDVIEKFKAILPSLENSY